MEGLHFIEVREARLREGPRTMLEAMHALARPHTS
jgi:hypothetical protein